METLGWVLDKEIPKNSIVKIGSANAFFYCYYNNDLTKDRLSQESNNELQALNRRLLRAYSETSKGKYIQRYKALISLFKPILERKVLSVYESDKTLEPNTYIIIIKGNEIGKYWNIDEYAEDNNLFINEKDKHYVLSKKERENVYGKY